MKQKLWMAMFAGAGVIVGAGVAHAIDNNNEVYTRTVEVNSILGKANAKLDSEDAATNPPSACFYLQTACAAVAQLDQAHANGLGVLRRIDRVETGTDLVSRGRRLDRIAWTADETRDVLGGIISPEFAGIISPEFAGIISPEYAGIISPEHTADLEDAVGIISPEIPGIISPEVTADLAGIISPEYQGISQSEKARIQGEIDAIIGRAETDLVLAHAMRRAIVGQ